MFGSFIPWGSGRLIVFAGAEARARRERAEAERAVEDHRGEESDGFVADATPLPSYKPTGSAGRKARKRRG